MVAPVMSRDVYLRFEPKTRSMKLHWMTLLLLFAACQSETQVAEQSALNDEFVRTAAAENSMAYILSPEDGAVVQSGELTVRFGLSGIGVAPAGIDFPNTGHHHLLINAEEVLSMDEPIPADSNHVHFGLGQTETTLDLNPGTYKLQLLLGDFAHIPHDPPVMSDPITITVE